MRENQWIFDQVEWEPQIKMEEEQDICILVTRPQWNSLGSETEDDVGLEILNRSFFIGLWNRKCLDINKYIFASKFNAENN